MATWDQKKFRRQISAGLMGLDAMLHKSGRAPAHSTSTAVPFSIQHLCPMSPPAEGWPSPKGCTCHRCSHSHKTPQNWEKRVRKLIWGQKVHLFLWHLMNSFHSIHSKDKNIATGRWFLNRVKKKLHRWKINLETSRLEVQSFTRVCN